MEKMKDLAYYNGKITSIDDMMIPANDRGFYFGDGIYEAAMVFDYKIYALQDHLDRMFNSAAMLRIELPYTKEEVGALLTDLVQKLEASSGSAKLCGLILRDGEMTLALNTRYVFAGVPEELDLRDIDGIRKWFTASLTGMGNLLDLITESPALMGAAE